jgi:hypothetical protein
MRGSLPAYTIGLVAFAMTEDEKEKAKAAAAAGVGAGVGTAGRPCCVLNRRSGRL